MFASTFPLFAQNPYEKAVAARCFSKRVKIKHQQVTRRKIALCCFQKSSANSKGSVFSD
jgi:hypothetical protein